MANIAIYTPFLPVIGGGERYLLTLANALQDQHQVTFLSSSPTAYQKLSNQLEIDTSQITFLEELNHKKFFKPHNPQTTYDMWICLSNHAYPPIQGKGKLNVAMIQFPYPYSKKEWFIRFQEKAYLASYNAAIVNSKFTESYAKKHINQPTHIIYPPVEVDRYQSIPSNQKQHQILSVGRFIAGKDSKCQLEMIRSFKKLCDTYPDANLHYICAGSTRPENVHQAYVKALKQEASNYPVTVLCDIPFSELIELYTQSKIFWHAKGFNSAHDRPEFTEHFGISTVEAMAAGCIPIVFQAGGQLEIVEAGQSGYFWQTEDELIQKTINIVQDIDQLSWMSQNAIVRSQLFSSDRFKRNVQNFVRNILNHL
jgi:glycosyltransferase involved in cell wall biosynthesis